MDGYLQIEETMLDYRYHISPRMYLIGDTEMGYGKGFIERDIEEKQINYRCHIVKYICDFREDKMYRNL